MKTVKKSQHPLVEIANRIGKPVHKANVNLAEATHEMRVNRMVEQLQEMVKRNQSISQFATDQEHTVDDLAAIYHKGKIVGLFNAKPVRDQWKKFHKTKMSLEDVATLCRYCLLNAEPKFENKELEVLVVTA